MRADEVILSEDTKGNIEIITGRMVISLSMKALQAMSHMQKL